MEQQLTKRKHKHSASDDEADATHVRMPPSSSPQRPASQHGMFLRVLAAVCGSMVTIALYRVSVDTAASDPLGFKQLGWVLAAFATATATLFAIRKSRLLFAATSIVIVWGLLPSREESSTNLSTRLNFQLGVVVCLIGAILVLITYTTIQSFRRLRPYPRAFRAALASFCFVGTALGFSWYSFIQSEAHAWNKLNALPDCKIQNVKFPWMDLLAADTINGWVKGHDCGRAGKFSTLVDGVLTVTCSTKATVELNPRMGSWKRAESPYPGVAAGDSFVYARPVSVDAQYMRVFCNGDEDFHFQVIRNSTVLGRVELSASQKSIGQVREQSKPAPASIAILMVDGLSRHAFRRRLKRSTALLNSLTEQTQPGRAPVRTNASHVAVELQHYHAVGGNSAPNLVALLNGRACDLSECPKDSFLWYAAQESGYVTQFVYGQCSDWVRGEWGNQHAQDFGVDNEFVAPFCHPDYDGFNELRNNFYGAYSIFPRCMAGWRPADIAAQASQQFFDTYHVFRRFSLSVIMDGHEGTGTAVAAADEAVENWIQTMSVRHPDTVLIVMSDHGLHMGPFFESYPGKVEMRFPIAWLVVPRSLAETEVDNEDGRTNVLINTLRYNAQYLTTHYDLHDSIRWLIDQPRALDAPKAYDQETDRRIFGKNLFTQTIGARDCASANIPDAMCVCDRLVLT